MALIIMFFLCSFISLLFYKCSLKLTTIAIIAFASFAIYFLFTLEIEDYYGRNNHVFFEGKKNDTVIILDRITNKIIDKAPIQKKSWNRVFIKLEKDTLELNEWIEQKAGYMADISCKLK